MGYYAVVTDHSVVNQWSELIGAKSIVVAKRQATREYGNGYHGHVIHVVECDAIDLETGRINDIPAYTKVIGPGNHKWQGE